MFLAIVGFGIGMQLWFRRRIVKEFSYDGRALRVRTLEALFSQTKPVEQASWPVSSRRHVKRREPEARFT